MKQAAALALALSLAAPLVAQTATFPDPANLSGERVSPRTGRELPIDQGSLGLQQLLRQLQTRASILNIVAHPDDEDGGMLTLNARGLGARVADLSLTRGEGGQNAMTGDFEDALGLLRTQELLANDRYTGVSQMFGTEVDFGFSKTKSEAFAKWTHDRVLYDAVRAIRIFRPLVITATFIGAPTDGHGQHQVSGEIAQEAFLAAGDPTVFPELTREGILPWQPLKMYARVPMGAISSKGLYDYATNQYVPAEFTNYVTGQKSTTPPTADILIHEGTPDPLLTNCAANPSDLPPNLSSRSAAEGSASPTTNCHELSYIQFARIGLGLQKSQIGPGFREARSGTFDVAYHLYASRLPSSKAPTARPIRAQGEALGTAAHEPRRAESPTYLPAALALEPTFFDGIDTSLEAIATLAPDLASSDRQNLARLATQIQQATPLAGDRPSAAAPALAEALHTARNLIQSIDASSLPDAQRSGILHELRIKQAQLNEALALALGLDLDATATTPDLVSGDRPSIWLHLSTTSKSDLTLNAETITNSIGATFAPQVLDENRRNLTSGHAIQRNLKLEPDVTLDITRPYFARDSIESPVYKLSSNNLRNAPSAPPALTAWADVDYRGETIRIGRILHSGAQPAAVVPPASISLSTHAQILPNAERTFSIRLTDSSTSPIASEALGATGWKASRLPATTPGSIHSDWKVDAPVGPRSNATLRASIKLKSGNSFTEGYRSVGYDDLPRTNYFTPATTRIVPVDLNLPKALRLAYLPGTGDPVPEALASIGLRPDVLTVADLIPTKLAAYDTIILGVRTYAAHSDLHGAPTQALLDFARNGGNVLVQYQTPEFTAADAPYPLDLGANEKVVDETAPVMLLSSGLEGGFSPPSKAATKGALAPADAATTLLTTPNAITPADFNNWIEERGHGFLQSWAPRYTALTETHDPGAPSEHVAPQLPQRGGLITTQLGRGRWTYCAFALYRQLPEANPGAFRLFINLIAPAH